MCVCTKNKEKMKERNRETVKKEKEKKDEKKEKKEREKSKKKEREKPKSQQKRNADPERKERKGKRDKRQEEDRDREGWRVMEGDEGQKGRKFWGTTSVMVVLGGSQGAVATLWDAMFIVDCFKSYHSLSQQKYDCPPLLGR